MLIYGASGHSKVIYDCLINRHIMFEGVFDDDPTKTEFLGNPVIGPYDSNYKKSSELIIGIGDNQIRKNLAKKIKHQFSILSHTSSVISPFSKIGKGTVIFQNATIQNSVSIGEHCIINSSASIDHDSRIGNFVHIAPNSTICGGVEIGDLSFIGAGSVIIQNIKIGKNVIIGAGSVVINDLPDNSIVLGNPAKAKKK